MVTVKPLPMEINRKPFTGLSMPDSIWWLRAVLQMAFALLREVKKTPKDPGMALLQKEGKSLRSLHLRHLREVLSWASWLSFSWEHLQSIPCIPKRVKI